MVTPSIISLSQEDDVDHPAKKARSCDGIYRSSILESSRVNELTFPVLNSTPATRQADSHTAVAAVEAVAADTGLTSGVTEISGSTPPVSSSLKHQADLESSADQESNQLRGKDIPLPSCRQPQIDTIELAGSLDGWLRQNMNLPSLKIFKRCEPAAGDQQAVSNTDVRMDSGFGSPIPGSPQWFRLQPSPGSLVSRASPSIEIEVLSPVVPEAYPEDDADMFTDSEDPSHTPMTCSPRFGFGSPLTTPRRRRPSRLAWGSSPLKESLGHCIGANMEVSAKPADQGQSGALEDSSMHGSPDSHNQENGLENRLGAEADVGSAFEMQVLEARFLQLLQSGGGCLPVTMALPLFRDYMYDERDKVAVRNMLSRWCTVRDSPHGDGRWLLLRSPIEQQGLEVSG